MIPHNRLTIGEDEALIAAKVIKSGRIAQGQEVIAFENEICEYLGYSDGHAVAVSSGTAALYLAIRAKAHLGIVNSVAIPAYSCSALRNAVILGKANPVYADIKDGSPNIDLLSDTVTNADITIAAHMYGVPMTIKDNTVIEDCAQAIGATIEGDKVGTQTSISVFSFYATKPITSGGEGGMVVSKDKEVINFLKDLRDFDMKNDNVLRFNFQMTDLQAAIGRIQFRKLDDFIERRRYLADKYEDKGIPLWNRNRGGIDYRGIVQSKDPLKLIEYLNSNGIKAIIPIEESELLCKKEYVPRAYLLTQTLVSIPLYPSLSDVEQDYIIP